MKILKVYVLNHQKPFHVLIPIFGFIETCILGLGAISDFLSYPSGFMGDTEPTTLIEILIAFVLTFIWFILLVVSIANLVKPTKIRAYILLIKVLILVPILMYWALQPISLLVDAPQSGLFFTAFAMVLVLVMILWITVSLLLPIFNLLPYLSKENSD